MHGGKEISAVVRDKQLHHVGKRAYSVGNGLQEVNKSLTTMRRHGHTAGVSLNQLCHLGRPRHVGLVEHDQLRNAHRFDRRKHIVHRVDVALGRNRTGINHMHEQIRFGDFVERALECFDQFVGKVPHEPNGVREQHHFTPGKRQTPGGGIEGGEQSVLHQHTCFGQTIEQGRLSGVGVADDSDGGLAILASAFSLIGTYTL